MFRTASTIRAATTLLALLMSGATATAMAQTPQPSTDKMPQHPEGMKAMGDMPGMSSMMGGPHHVLAMAYRDNLVTFARAVKGRDSSPAAVNLDLVRPAVTEMRRSFNQMLEHHQAQMKAMSAPADSAMSGSMPHMETHLAALRTHLAALESEVGGRVPDPKKVSHHAAAIVEECAGMAMMPGKAEPHQMR